MSEIPFWYKDIATFLALCTGFFGSEYFTGNPIPRVNEVQQGYIAPSDVRILCKDLDNNRELETLIKIREQDYLLREVDGKPVISAYELKPVEIKPVEVLKE